MSGIIIDNIKFENYRQYGTGSISFDHSKDKMLSILIAKNGTGKTTFLNSITWCLYEQEFQLSNKIKGLPLVNSKVLSELSEDELVAVKVTLTILDNDRVVEFERMQWFKVIINDKGVKDVVADDSELTVTITVKNDFSNSEVRRGPDAELTVDQYFNQNIYDFYFFDGENLREFLAPGREKDIKRSINNISQVSLLESVCEHIGKIKDTKTRKLGKESPDIEALYAEKERIEDDKRKAEAVIETGKRAIEKSKGERDRINETLKKYGPTIELAEEREILENDSKKLDEERKSFYSDRSSFIRRYAMLLNMYPSIIKVLNFIENKEIEGELPPSIDIDQVRFLLDNLDQPCPLCDHEIGESGRQHLERLLNQYSVSSKTSNFLKEIKGSLESFVREVHQYKEKRKQLTEREKDIQNRTDEIDERLKEINKLLINYKEDGSDKIDIAKLEGQRNALEDEIGDKNRLIGAAEKDIKNCDESIKRINMEIEAAGSKLSEFEELKQELKILDSMGNAYKTILSKITGGMKTEIEDTTREFFESMNWKVNTFGEMEIDENYTISVYDKAGLEMTGTISATEKMALAYAFILAIHQASGRNCPFVIDSPIGRASDDNREDIARALMNVSESKQIIMLFTPDDYSPPVQRMYDGCAEVKKLSLTDDEKYVEGIIR